jgi:Trypsin-like peptidase domain
MAKKGRDRNRRDRKSEQARVSKTPISLQRALDDLPLRLDLGGLVARITGLKVLELLAPFTVMLAITKIENPAAPDVFRNGTGTLVDTGQRKLLVTNHHVYEKFEECRREAPHTRLVMSGVDGQPFANISGETLIASDETRDLAVLAISPSIVEQLGKRFYRATAWPPRRPEVGARVVLVGYPAQGRHALGSGSLGVMPLSIGRTVTSVGDRHFLMANETQDSYAHAPDGHEPVTDYGGISGSAAYSVYRLPDKREELYLCGFAKEAGFNNTILVAHADFINADGSIR